MLEIDLTLFSDSVEIDSGRWVIAGGDAHGEDSPMRRAITPDADGRAPLLDESDRVALLDDWLRYRSAFAEQPA
ncbi:hypothetical protein [Cumulibacter manganitolerans]|uniref:hypothetical protein n=1 Tax=Cumulibacter manganitolerans TaxID=1884992 RepID=UPI0018864C61|nr:hypothetical protein [Cumulibacter manganitolerans]